MPKNENVKTKNEKETKEKKKKRKVFTLGRQREMRSESLRDCSWTDNRLFLIFVYDIFIYRRFCFRPELHISINSLARAQFL